MNKTKFTEIVYYNNYCKVTCRVFIAENDPRFHACLNWGGMRLKCCNVELNNDRFMRQRVWQLSCTCGKSILIPSLCMGKCPGMHSGFNIIDISEGTDLKCGFINATVGAQGAQGAYEPYEEPAEIVIEGGEVTIAKRQELKENHDEH